LLFDDIDDAACAGFDQHRAAVHDRIAISARAVLRRDLVVGNATFRKHHADSHVFPILIGRAPLLDHIGPKARTLIDSQDAGHAADDTADHAADDGPDGTSRSFTIPRAPLDAARHALGLRCKGN
jgi:hypothetical protein